MRSKTTLDSLGFLAQGFWSWFCKLTLFDTVISGQSFLALLSVGNQTWPLIRQAAGQAGAGPFQPNRMTQRE